ncbi:MAG: hypothetical protein Q8R24_02555 [Legionellaceae bacterium]|nr:hypothetical protein [Legionellaceae bacterium]
MPNLNHKHVELMARIARAISRVCLKKCTDELESMRSGDYKQMDGSSGKLNGVNSAAQKNAADSDEYYETLNVLHSGHHGMNQPK